MTDQTSHDDLGRALLVFAARLAHATRHRLGRLDPPLTYFQYRILGHVSEGATSLTLLREPTTVSLPTLSETVDNLARRGLLDRSPSALDRRGVDLALTDAGAGALAAARAALADLTDHLLTGVSASNRTALRRALRAMDARVEALLAADHGR